MHDAASPSAASVESGVEEMQCRAAALHRELGALEVLDSPRLGGWLEVAWRFNEGRNIWHSWHRLTLINQVVETLKAEGGVVRRSLKMVWMIVAGLLMPETCRNLRCFAAFPSEYTCELKRSNQRIKFFVFFWIYWICIHHYIMLCFLVETTLIWMCRKPENRPEKSNQSKNFQAQLLQSRRYADQAQQQAVVMAQQHLQVGPNAVTIGLQQSLHKFLCWYSLLFHCLNSLQ